MVEKMDWQTEQEITNAAAIEKKKNKKKATESNGKSVAMHVSMVSVIVNLALSVGKLLAGIFAHSGAMISDAVHSASDVLSTFVVMIGVTISAKDRDADHPYGHDRLECVAALILAVLLLATGLIIGWNGIEKAQDLSKVATPGVLAIVAAAVSIGVKEWMYHYTMRAAKQVNSGALKADAWHHRSDALSSIGALAGIVGARMGLAILDPIAQIVIAVMVIKVAFDIAKESFDKMVDHSVDQKTIDAIWRIAAHHPGVKGVDDLRSRTFGSKFYVDLEIAVDRNLNITEAHEIAESLHDKLEEKFPTLKHCMIHVNPEGEGHHE